MSCLNAIALFKSFSGNIQGTVHFHQCSDQSGTHVDIDLHNIQPGKIHAIHIHEHGDEREGCISLGGHWNPTIKTHGSLFLGMPSHSGDMINNIKGNSKGKFKYAYHDPRINLRGDVNDSIIGRSVVIHQGNDDLGLGGMDPYNPHVRRESLKTGNAGKRMACSIIGRAMDGPLI